MAERRIKVTGDLTSDDTFQSAMQGVEQKGFIPSHRAGDTGIGKTLEDELGIEENPIQAADLGSVELKATRKDSGSSDLHLQNLPLNVVLIIVCYETNMAIKRKNLWS